MKKKKLILNIDGPKGVGKTTQIGLLSKDLISLGFSVQVNTLDEPIQDKLLKSLDLLRDDGVDIIINEGSFLRTLAEDFLSGMPKEKVLENNRRLIELNENTRHEFPQLNIIMFNEDTEALRARLEKFARLTKSEMALPDAKKEADILVQIIGFEKSMVVLNSDIKLVYIDLNSSMLEVLKKLKETIASFV